MSLMFIVYVVGLIPNIIGLLQGLLALCGAIGLLLVIALPAWWDDQFEMVVGNLKKYAFIPITAAILLVVVPSEKTTYYMIAAYGTEKLIENPTAQALASDGVDVLKELLAKAKRELTEEKPKESTK